MDEMKILVVDEAAPVVSDERHRVQPTCGDCGTALVQVEGRGLKCPNCNTPVSEEQTLDREGEERGFRLPSDAVVEAGGASDSYAFIQAYIQREASNIVFLVQYAERPAELASAIVADIGLTAQALFDALPRE